MVSEHIDKDKWVNLDDLLKLRQNVRLLDEGGWEDDIQAVPVEAIKGLAKLDIVRCKKRHTINKSKVKGDNSTVIQNLNTNEE